MFSDFLSQEAPGTEYQAPNDLSTFDQLVRLGLIRYRTSTGRLST